MARPLLLHCYPVHHCRFISSSPLRRMRSKFPGRFGTFRFPSVKEPGQKIKTSKSSNQPPCQRLTHATLAFAAGAASRAAGCLGHRRLQPPTRAAPATAAGSDPSLLHPHGDGDCCPSNAPPHAGCPGPLDGTFFGDERPTRYAHPFPCRTAARSQSTETLTYAIGLFLFGSHLIIGFTSVLWLS